MPSGQFHISRRYGAFSEESLVKGCNCYFLNYAYVLTLTEEYYYATNTVTIILKCKKCEVQIVET